MTGGPEAPGNPVADPGDGTVPEPTDRSPPVPEEAPGDEGPVGPFPSWSWLYGVVVAYGLLVIVVLTLLTRLLDPGTP